MENFINSWNQSLFILLCFVIYLLALTTFCCSAFLPAKSQTESTLGVSGQKFIPMFLFSFVKSHCLSTFPQVADLITAQSVITSHFLQ